MEQSQEVSRNVAVEVVDSASSRSTDWMAANQRLVSKFTLKKRAFLRLYSENASIAASCTGAGISRTSYANWMHEDENFRLAFASAKSYAIQSLEDEVVRRGMHGFEEPVFFRDQVVGHKTKYSDTLLMFYLNGNAPEKYRQRASLEHAGPGGGPILTVALLDEIVKD